MFIFFCLTNVELSVEFTVVNYICPAKTVCTLLSLESHINQLQYRLDKLKEEQSDQEQVTREQVNELEMRNNT